MNTNTNKNIGILVQQILLSIINKEDPLYGMHYEMPYKKTHPVYGDRVLVLYNDIILLSFYDDIIPDKNLQLYFKLLKGTVITIITSNDIHLLKFDKKQKCSSKEFEENRFALSTVLSLEELTSLEIGAYGTDFPEFQGKSCVLRIKSLQEFYNTLSSR